ncbi:MAG: VWA domain-containing protein [Lentisphaerae bacterium]|nr:VWA domain-containing protein [Lentisphaerota bacterium]
MNFVYPGLLYGLVLGAIPIIVYYLMRFRSQRVAWGADYILERALARRRRKLYWDQIILLALRALVVMALVAAFARPRSRKAVSMATDGEALRIVLIDGSYSMLAGDGARTRNDAAREAVRELVARWGRGEKWSLYVMDSRPRWVVDHADVVDAAHSLAVIDALQVQETAVSLAAGLEAVLQHAAGQRREIFIFADDQAAAWEGLERVTPAADANTRLFWMRPPLADRRNLAVTRLEAGHERVLRGFPFSVYAQVRNFSAETVRDAELTLLVDGARYGAERVSLPPEQSARVRLEVRIDEPGSHLITARLSGDALDFDNAMSAGIDVSDAVSLLVLRDADRSGKFESAAGFLSLAARVLAGGGAREATGPLRVREHTEAQCDVAALAACDAVVLDGGRTVTPELARALRGYVDQGGTLVLAADDTIDLAAWRRHLGKAGLLPAVPARARSEPLGGQTFRRLSASGFDLPALRDFETGAEGDIAQVRFYTWLEFEAADPEAEVLARFTDGAPFAWRRRFERGAVLLLAAGLNSRNNNLLVRETVYPFLLRLFAEAAGAGQYPRRVGRSAPVRYMARGEPPPVAAQFGLEGEEPAPAALVPDTPGTRVEYRPGADRSGPASLLVLRENSRERVWIGVQGERSDSSLTPMPDAYRARMAERFGWTEVGSAGELMEALEADGRGAERYGWVMAAALLFALGELLMGLRFV